MPQESFNRVIDHFSKRLHRALYNGVLERTGVNTGWPETDRKLVEELGISVNEFHTFKHSPAVRDAISTTALLDLESVGNAFVAGFTKDKAAFRSVLRGYALCRHLKTHRFTEDPDSGRCKQCGLRRDAKLDSTATAMLNAAFGELGYRDEVITSTWSMKWFLQSGFNGPSTTDLTGMQQFFDLIADAPDHYTAKTFSRKLPNEMFGNAAGKRNALTTLILAGVLESRYPERLLDAWTPWKDRTYDWSGMPRCPDWTRADGVNPAVFERIFPNLSLPTSLSNA